MCRTTFAWVVLLAAGAQAWVPPVQRAVQPGLRPAVTRPDASRVAWTLRATPSASDDAVTTIDGPAPWRTPLIGAVWLGFIVYAFGFAPGLDDAAKAADAVLLETLIKDPASPAVEPLFKFIFSSLGLIPLMNLAILWPGGERQKIPPQTLILSLAAGFFAAAPYLALREFRPTVSEGEWNGLASKVFENRLFGAAMTLGATKLAFDAGVEVAADPASHLAAMKELFWSSTFAHVSTLDLTVLSVVFFGTIGEDMRRRDWYSFPKALAFSAVPVLGPALYLLARPALVRTPEAE